MYLFNQLLLILINRQILFATIINKFILRNSTYLSVLIEVTRGKQVSLFVRLICVFWQLSEPLAVTLLDVVIFTFVILVRSKTHRKKVLQPSTWRPRPLIEVVGVETRVEWEADNNTNFLLCLPKPDWLLLFCRAISTTSISGL